MTINTLGKVLVQMPTPFGLKLSITTYVKLFHPICTIELWLDVRECVEFVDSDFIWKAYVNLCKKSCILSHLGNVGFASLHNNTSMHIKGQSQTWFIIHMRFTVTTVSFAMECRQTLSNGMKVDVIAYQSLMSLV